MTLWALDVGEGPTAVLLHGQPGGAGDWSAVTTRLREQMRVVVPDRPGYGHTGGRALGFGENATVLIEMLDRLEIESTVLAGHSWGTGVGLAAAIHFPERVKALVLAAPVSPGLPAGALDRALAHPLFGPPATRLGFWFAGLGLSLLPLRRLAHVAAPALPPEQVAATAGRWRAEDVWKSFYVEQRALVAELPALAPRLSSLEVPTTILYGTQDRISPPAHPRQLAGLIPNADLVSVDHAGHMLPVQRPDIVAGAIVAAAAISS